MVWVVGIAMKNVAVVVLLKIIYIEERVKKIVCDA